jgi:AcrR family transcriptional regulator
MSSPVVKLDLADHRERLMAGLAASIRDVGLANTTITTIVRHARASRTTFYRCFADKEACFLALAERLAQATLVAIRDAVDPEAPWGAQVDGAIDAYVQILSSDPDIVVTFVRDLPLLGERAAGLRRAGLEAYARAVVLASQSGAMREAGVDMSMDRATMLIGGLEAMVVRAVERGEPVADLAPVAKDLAHRVLAPAP